METMKKEEKKNHEIFVCVRCTLCTLCTVYSVHYKRYIARWRRRSQGKYIYTFYFFRI